MRSFVVLAVLGLAAPLRAADAPKDKASAAGAPSTASSAASSEGGGGPAGSMDRTQLSATATGPVKRWEVGLSYELHTLIRQNDLAGAAPNKVFNFFYLYGQFDITPRNRLSLRGGIYERFLADDGESGVRMSDLVLSYSRLIPLPWKISARAVGSLSAPTSFYSQKAGLITAPTITVQLDRRFGGFSVDARVFGSFFFYTHTTPNGGGNPNPEASLGWLLEAEYAFWFLKSLAIGLDFFDEYVWYYDVHNGAPANSQFVGVVSDAQFPTQPVQQVYGGEVFLRYTLPTLVGIKSDVTLAYAQGDPTLGYTSVLHDGVAHVYPFWRQTSQIYGVLSARY
jgi:hypothetical protein